MKKNVRLKSYGSVFATLLALPLLGAGCSEDNPLSDALCCQGFEVGADLSGVNFDLSGAADVRFKAFAQAGSDLAAVAAATLDDVRISCENIARDLGATEADVTAAEALSGRAAVDRWCDLAVAQIDANVGAQGELGVDLEVRFEPPACQVSVDATLDCKAGCAVEGSCDVDAQVPRCEGGKLVVECRGTCEPPSADVAVSCTGSCSAECSGSCTAEVDARVACQGRCEGTCAADAQGNGNGTTATGECNGFCEGTCTPEAGVMAMCEGTCNGSCQGSCTAQANVKFECDGECNGDFEAPKCEGGKLEIDCNLDAECDASCDASASARAECQPPRVEIGYDVSAITTLEAQARVEATVASLEANLPGILLAFRARGETFRNAVQGALRAGGAIVLEGPDDLSVKAVACSPLILSTIETAGENFVTALEASGSVAASLEIR